jgi:hypothetical protein
VNRGLGPALEEQGETMASALRLTLTGHLTSARLGTALGVLEGDLGAENRPLIVDFRQVTGYDPEARILFIDWNKRLRSRLRAVAILSANSFWPVMVSAMALATKQRMRVFADERSALEWVVTGAD